MIEKTNLNELSAFVNSNAEIINKTLDLGAQITDVYAESQRIAGQVEMMKEFSKVQLAKVAAKYTVTREIIERTFGERREALSNFYQALDLGISNQDNALILSAMQQISAIVVSSPLDDIQEFNELFEDTSRPLLDF